MAVPNDPRTFPGGIRSGHLANYGNLLSGTPRQAWDIMGHIEIHGYQSARESRKGGSVDLRPTIVIYADYGIGPYAWLRTWAGPGGNVADCHGWGFEWPITLDLESAFSAWAVEFERAPAPWDGEAANRAYDWAAFNRRGVALARRLKRELGTGVRVIYMAPHEDPNHEGVGSLEVRDDGSLLRSSRRA